jgi:hypothetical protein
VSCIPLNDRITIADGSSFTALEQVDQMMEEVPARQSAKWRPHESFASKIGAANNGSKMDELNVNNSSKMDELNMKETEQQHLEASRV